MTKSSAEKTCVLVDGSSYLYRAYHALPALTTSNGQPTGAVRGVISMVRKLINDIHPDLMAVVFDAKGKTFRDELFKDYKAHRPPMPKELQEQITPIHNIIEALGIPLLSVEGVEADDVIATLAFQAGKQGIKTIISTGDKDLAQLVNGDISLVNTMTDVTLDRQGVIEKFGIPPELIVDYLTLVGDSVDNIPGVPKVGPKTAVKWLTEFGSLDAIIQNAGSIKGAIGENLRSVLDKLPLSKQLVTVKCDVDLPCKPTELHLKNEDQSALINLYKSLEFNTWLDELLSKKPEKNSASAFQYEVILDEKQFSQWLKKLSTADYFAYDSETTSLNYIAAEIVGMSFALPSGEAAYLPVGHDYLGAPKQLDRDQVLEKLRSIFEDDKKIKIGQNLKYDKSVLANYAIDLQGIQHDTMLESYILNSTATRHDLDSLGLKYLGHKTIHFEDIAGKGSKQLTFNQIQLEQAAPYAAEDAWVTLRLHQSLWPKLEPESGMRNVYETIEIPLISVLSRMERKGVSLDVSLLNQQSKELGKSLHELREQIIHLAGETFNIDSPKQLQEILYEKLKLPILKKTPTGQPSTAEPVLQELAYDYPLPKLILNYRSLSKLKSTYTDKLPLQVDEKTGRVHTSFQQAVAATGRLASTDPNLQNIPIRTAEGRKIRQAFIAAPGYQMVAADYSQIELRIMAHLSNDRGLHAAFDAGLDVHRATAAEVFGVKIDEVTGEQRRKAKAINFGLIYGMSAFGLAKQLGISRLEAQKYIEIYFHRYPGVREYMESTRLKAKEQGYVETLFGRRLYLPDINSPNRIRSQAAERTAINAPMQGTAADIIKCAMIDIDAWLRKSKLNAAMIMQVHDELVFEVPESELEKILEEVPHRMSGAAKLVVPLEVSIGHGKNWDEAH